MNGGMDVRGDRRKFRSVWTGYAGECIFKGDKDCIRN